MKIHTDRLTASDIYSAALTARVDVIDLEESGSKSHERKFSFRLEGESNRRPNFGTARVDRFDRPERAATWDQWGVFLAILFYTDAERTFEVSRNMMTDRHEDIVGFAHRTQGRFTPVKRYLTPGGAGWLDYWPADAHGDHSWTQDGTPYQRQCRRCTAVEDYSPPLGETWPEPITETSALPDRCMV
jgi:hypothetical protein